MFELSSTALVIVGLVISVIGWFINKEYDKLQQGLIDLKNELADKASNESLQNMEFRFKESITEVKDTNRDTINQLTARHDKELADLENRLGARIDRSEENILRHISLLIETFKKE